MDEWTLFISNVTGRYGQLVYAMASQPMIKIVSKTSSTVSTTILATPQTSMSPSHSAMPTSEPPRSVDRDLSKGVKAGIGIGVSLATILFALLIIMLWRRKSHTKQDKVSDELTSWSKAELDGKLVQHAINEAHSTLLLELPGSHVALPSTDPVELPVER